MKLNLRIRMVHKKFVRVWCLRIKQILYFLSLAQSRMFEIPLISLLRLSYQSAWSVDIFTTLYQSNHTEVHWKVKTFKQQQNKLPR